jgi:hypothetical protein
MDREKARRRTDAFASRPHFSNRKQGDQVSGEVLAQLLWPSEI